MHSVAQLIKKARDEAGMTQSELARRAGTSQANIAKYETGRMSPSVSTLERVLHAAGFGLHLAAVPEQAPTDLSGRRARKLRSHRMEILRIARAHGASNVRIFGSVARGEDDAGSDIDLLVDYDVSNGIVRLIELQHALEDLLEESVDVAPVSMLKPAVARHALGECVPL